MARSGMIKGVAILVSILACCLSGIGGDRELIIAYENIKPAHYRNTDGKIIGSDAEVLTTVLDKIGQRYKFVEISWKRTLLDLKAGRVDIGIAAKYTDERAKFAHYSEPYRIIRHYLVVRNGEFHKDTTFASFLAGGDRIGGVIGWGYPDHIAGLLADKRYEKQVHRVEIRFVATYA